VSHLREVLLRAAVRGAAGALAASVTDHDVFAGVADKLIIVAEAQAVAGRIQPARRGVGVMVACEDHAVQRLIVKVEIHLELKAPHVRGRVSLVVDVEGLRRLVRGCVRVLFTASPSVRAVVSMRAMDE